MRDLQVWMRVGDADSYHGFDSPEEAAFDLTSILSFGAGEIPAFDVERYKGAGLRGVVVHGTAFTGNNGISLFWGDNDAQFESELSDIEIEAFAITLESELLPA